MKPVTPLLAVDAIIIHGGKIVAIRRLNEPFKGQFALPGGFVDIGETVEQAVVREAKEETNLDIKIVKMVGIYSDPRRDVRGHVVSICYLALGSGIMKAGDDAKDIRKFRVPMLETKDNITTQLDNSIPKLAFDHDRMLLDARKAILEIILRETYI
jgi:8-oxo-dGTP diphosphatase